MQIVASWGAQLLDWLNTYTFPEEMRLSDPAYAGDIAARYLDLTLAHGTTTVASYCTIHPHSADALFQAAEERGQRIVAGKTCMDRNAPEGLRDTAQSAYDDSKMLIDRWHGKGRASYAITPRFTPTSTPEQLAALGALWTERPDCLMQTHLSEQTDEIAWVKSLYPDARDYLDTYEAYGLLGPGGLYGHANLYGVFTDIAVRWTKKGGTIAYLTPTSFLSGHYYSALRELMAKEAPPAAIDFVHARRGVFEDVLQETLLAAYRRGAKPGRAQVHYVEVTSEREARLIRNGTIGLPSPASQPWLAPREPRHSALIAKAEAMPARLADWGYSVSTGPLVWNRYKDQMQQRSARGVHPLIWAEAVSADGRFAFRAEKRNHAPYFKIERGDAWLLIEEACVLVQRTTAKEQARRLIAAELPADFIAQHGGVVVENHLNMVRPAARPAVSPATVAAVLNSRIVDQLFRCINGSVAVSAFEMEALPLPSPAAMKQVEALVGRGACSAEIEDELARLYGQVAP